MTCMVSACVTTQQTLSPSGFSAQPDTSARSAPTPRDAQTAGFEIEGNDFHAAITFREIDGRAAALFRGDGFRTGPVDTEFDLTQPWISDGERIYTEDTSYVRVQVSMRTRACEASNGVGAREASVLVGRLVYRGCARETGPHPSWTENLPALMPEINQCVSAARNSSMAFVRGSGQAHILYAGQERAGTRVRMRFGESGRWDCLMGGRGPEFSVVSDRAEPAPGEADPVYIPGSMPPDGEGCYLYEAVYDASGARAGALAYDVCGTGAIALSQLDRGN
ncbi:MAG: hypothetical protein LAT81_03860 [Oceanicaulis sp.]|nr:hypothetical protein [Oceanicaulis sp.]